MDSLGGILTNGLLGNLILGGFHLNLFGAEVTVEVRAGSTGYARPELETPRLHVRIKFKGKEVNRSYELTEKKATFLIKNFSGVRRVVNLVSVTVSNLVIKPVKRMISVVLR